MLSLLNNRPIPPILIGIAIFLWVLFLKPLYETTIEKETTLSTLEKKFTQKEKDYNDILLIKEKWNSGTLNDISARVKKLGRKFNTSDIMQTVMLNDFTKSSIGNPAHINISSISVDKGRKLPNGLSLGSVNIAIQATSVDDIVSYITYLTTASDFAFTLDNISLPIDTNPGEGDVILWYGLTLSLGVYHYE